jgi:hypothetical protein
VCVCVKGKIHQDTYSHLCVFVCVRVFVCVCVCKYDCVYVRCM